MLAVSVDEALHFHELEFLHVSSGKIVTNFMIICGMFSVLSIYHISFNLILITTNLLVVATILLCLKDEGMRQRLSNLAKITQLRSGRFRT